MSFSAINPERNKRSSRALAKVRPTHALVLVSSPLKFFPWWIAYSYQRWWHMAWQKGVFHCTPIQLTQLLSFSLSLPPHFSYKYIPLPLYWICSAPSPLLVKTLSALHWVCSSLLEKQGTCRFASLFPLFSSLLPPPPTGLHVLPFSNMGSSPLSISMLLLHLGNALFSPFLSFSLSPLLLIPHLCSVLSSGCTTLHFPLKLSRFLSTSNHHLPWKLADNKLQEALDISYLSNVVWEAIRPNWKQNQKVDGTVFWFCNRAPCVWIFWSIRSWSTVLSSDDRTTSTLFVSFFNIYIYIYNYKQNLKCGTHPLSNWLVFSFHMYVWDCLQLNDLNIHKNFQLLRQREWINVLRYLNLLWVMRPFIVRATT